MAFLLVVVIMVQNPKGGGLSSSFGGGGGAQIGGVQKTSDFLDKVLGRLQPLCWRLFCFPTFSLWEAIQYNQKLLTKAQCLQFQPPKLLHQLQQIHQLIFSYIIFKNASF